MGGPSLDEIDASEGIIPGGSTEEVSAGGNRFADVEDPDDKTSQKESTCNKTGQHCSGKRGGKGSGGSDCPAMAFVIASPGIWSPPGWAAIIAGELYCAASGGD